jgi:hypothetical protein
MRNIGDGGWGRGWVVPAKRTPTLHHLRRAQRALQKERRRRSLLEEEGQECRKQVLEGAKWEVRYIIRNHFFHLILFELYVHNKSLPWGMSISRVFSFFESTRSARASCGLK